MVSIFPADALVVSLPQEYAISKSLVLASVLQMHLPITHRFVVRRLPPAHLLSLPLQSSGSPNLGLIDNNIAEFHWCIMISAGTFASIPVSLSSVTHVINCMGDWPESDMI